MNSKIYDNWQILRLVNNEDDDTLIFKNATKGNKERNGEALTFLEARKLIPEAVCCAKESKSYDVTSCWQLSGHV